MKNISFAVIIALLGIASASLPEGIDLTNLNKKVHKMTRGAPAALDLQAHELLQSV